MAAKWLAYGTCFLATGTTLFLLASKGLIDIQAKPSFKLHLRRAILTMVVLALLASLAQMVVQAGRLLDDGLAGMVDPEMIGIVYEGALGNSVTVRLIGLAMIAVAALRNWKYAVFLVFAGPGALLVATSFSLVGHATQEPRWLLTLLVTIHVLAVSFWIGALLPLYRAASGLLPLPIAAHLAHRFGQQATLIVPLLIVAGGVLSYQFVGTWAAMFTTQYGLTLALKLALVASLLLLASANKFRIVPDMLAGSDSAARRLQRTIRLEAIAFMLILVVTSVLTTATPLPPLQLVSQ